MNLPIEYQLSDEATQRLQQRDKCVALFQEKPELMRRKGTAILDEMLESERVKVDRDPYIITTLVRSRNESEKHALAMDKELGNLLTKAQYTQVMAVLFNDVLPRVFYSLQRDESKYDYHDVVEAVKAEFGEQIELLQHCWQTGAQYSLRAFDEPSPTQTQYQFALPTHEELRQCST